MSRQNIVKVVCKQQNPEERQLFGVFNVIELTLEPG